MTVAVAQGGGGRSSSRSSRSSSRRGYGWRSRYYSSSNSTALQELSTDFFGFAREMFTILSVIGGIALVAAAISYLADSRKKAKQWAKFLKNTDFRECAPEDATIDLLGIDFYRFSFEYTLNETMVNNQVVIRDIKLTDSAKSSEKKVTMKGDDAFGSWKAEGLAVQGYNTALI